MISSYYAKVGVGVDNSSLKTVDAYLNKIEKQLRDFQSKVGRTRALQLEFRINQATLNRLLKQSLLVAGQTSTLRIGKVSFNKDAVNKALTQAMGGHLGTTGRTGARIGARLSRDSIMAMREQIRAGLSNIIIRPNINPRIHAASGRYPAMRERSRERKSSGRINPFIFSGLPGSFLRFGMFALPGVAGAMGLNTLANNAAMLQNQQIMMNTAMGSPQVAKEQMKFLSNLGDVLGRKTSTMAPYYAQMYAGARGTSMEPTLQSGFTSLMNYASVMGLGDEQLKGSIRA
jgi:hypothetical protein